MITFFKNIINAIRRLFGAKEEQKEVDVPQGLQVWDENGDVQIDTATSTTTILESHKNIGKNTTINITNPALSQGRFFYMITPINSFKQDIEVKKTGEVTAQIKTNNESHNNQLFNVYIGVY